MNKLRLGGGLKKSPPRAWRARRARAPSAVRPTVRPSARPTVRPIVRPSARPSEHPWTDWPSGSDTPSGSVRPRRDPTVPVGIRGPNLPLLFFLIMLFFFLFFFLLLFLFLLLLVLLLSSLLRSHPLSRAHAAHKIILTLR